MIDAERLRDSDVERDYIDHVERYRCWRHRNDHVERYITDQDAKYRHTTRTNTKGKKHDY